MSYFSNAGSRRTASLRSKVKRAKHGATIGASKDRSTKRRRAKLDASYNKMRSNYKKK